MTLEALQEKAKSFSLSTEYVDSKERGRQQFLQKFPKNTIANLTLDEYVIGTGPDSFCYWLEFKKIDQKTILFGIRTGTSAKFGLYKSKDDQYYIGYGENRKVLYGEELATRFIAIKTAIVEALTCVEENRISDIKALSLPLGTMVLQKILAIYYPEKFITIGAADTLITLAKDLEIEGIELSSKNLIEINFECKKKLSEYPEFRNWGYEQMGGFIWENYRPVIDPVAPKNTLNHWLYSPGENAEFWDDFYNQGIMALGWDDLGDLTNYASKEDIATQLQAFAGQEGSKKNDATANYEFKAVMKVGDIVMVKKGRNELLGFGVVSSEYYFDAERTRYKHCRKINWLKKGVWEVDHKLVLKTLTNISAYKSETPQYRMYYERLLAAMGEYGATKNHKEAYIKWLNKTIPTDSGTKSSYLRAIDILSEKLGYDIYDIDDTAKIDFLYADLIVEQRVDGGKYFYEKAPSYGKKGFYSAAIKTYSDFLKEYLPRNTKQTMTKFDLPLNTILYGPPGTGKTYVLKNKYMPMFTASESSITQEEFLNDIIQNCSWWQVIALALLDLGPVKVAAILNHKFIKIKAQLSNSNTITQTIWGQLQSHTIDTCEYVKVQKKRAPYIFNKTDTSNWELVLDEVKEQAPEILEIKAKMDGFSENTNLKIERFEFLTFHQSYAYEDFIEGIKPELSDSEVAYKIEEGIFQKMCNRARNDSANKYALFIDEINRGNISSIFGELITLIEDDKREGKPNQIKATLPYSKQTLSVPSNLYIIGTMNTADRSVEALDTALRRRFSFIEMNPDPKQLSQEAYKVEGVNLESLLAAINGRIEKLLDKDYAIGHSYFMNIQNRANPLDELKGIFQNKILPLLQEYFYGDWGKIMLVLGKEFVYKKIETVKFLSDDLADDYEEYNEKPIYGFTDAQKWTIDSFISIYA
jgi:Cdc6-like AAA superfamily ATPase